MVNYGEIKIVANNTFNHLRQVAKWGFLLAWISDGWSEKH